MRVPIFTIDGIEYQDINVASLDRSFAVLDGPNAGRVMNYDMKRDVGGTFYNYSLAIDPNYSDLKQYDELYEVLSAPDDSHTIVMPYGQGTLTFKAYVTNGNDSLIQKRPTFNKWNNLRFNFIAMSPQRRPG